MRGCWGVFDSQTINHFQNPGYKNQLLYATWADGTEDWLFGLHQVRLWADQVYNILVFGTERSGQEGGRNDPGVGT